MLKGGAGLVRRHLFLKLSDRDLGDHESSADRDGHHRGGCRPGAAVCALGNGVAPVWDAVRLARCCGSGTDWRRRDTGSAIVCWLARPDVQSSVAQSLIVAMLFYNLAVAAVLTFAGLGDGMHGVLLWPAVVFHVAIGGWCVATLYRNENGKP